ncbi:MAG: tripartite tricarboxylate transporter permease [Butyricicoccus sp.]
MTVTAIFCAFMLQGMVPGPLMFKEHSDILGIMIGLVVINILMLIIGRVFTPLYANITRIPYELMSAIIIVYCITGVYSSEASIPGTSGGHRRIFVPLRKLGSVLRTDHPWRSSW